VAIAERLLTSASTDPRFEYQLANAHYAEGTAELLGGNARDATVSFEKAATSFEALAARDPAYADALRRATLAHKRLGAILGKQGQLPQALAHYRKAVAWDEARVARDSKSVQARQDLSVSLVDLGWVLAAGGDHRAAIEQYQRALAIREDITRSDPANAAARHKLASVLTRLGHAYRVTGHSREALAFYKRAEETLGPKTTDDEMASDLAGGRSSAYAALGQWDEALRNARVAVSIHQGFLAKDPANNWHKLGVASGLLGVGDALVGLATRAGTAAPTSRMSWREAADAYREVLRLTSEAQSAGGVLGDDARMADEARAGRGRCQRALAGANGVAPPPRTR
jgi:tetratricopeptide (TPR) repeat protein